MREELNKFDVEQDLEDLKADIDKLKIDIGHLMRKSTRERIGCGARRRFSSLLWAFGAGASCCALLKLFLSRSSR